MHVIPLLLILLTSRLEAVETELPPDETAQVVLPGRRPRIPTLWLEQLESVKQQNSDLKKIVQALEPYREMSGYLQQRLSDCEESLGKAQKRIQTLQQGASSLMQANQAQSARDRQLIEKLRQEIETSSLKTEARVKGVAQALEKNLAQEKLEYQKLVSVKNQLELELQNQKNRGAQGERLIQYLRERAETVQKENQSLQTSLENCDKQLRALRSSSPPVETGDEATYVKQIRNLKRDLDDNRTLLDNLQRQNDRMNIENESVKKQLQGQAKRLETYEQGSLNSVTQLQATEAHYQALFDEKVAAIEKWRQANTLLQSQIDSAASINAQLRQQVAELQTKCEKKE